MSRSGVEERKSFDERFWDRVDKKSSDQCWNWTRSRFHTGYGMFYHHRRKISAHRWAKLGSSCLDSHDVNECVLHTCNNRLCCNPDHLYIGSHRDNTIQAFKDKRRRRGRPTNGELALMKMG
jgi:hypothetical protein